MSDMIIVDIHSNSGISTVYIDVDTVGNITSGYQILENESEPNFGYIDYIILDTYGVNQTEVVNPSVFPNFGRLPLGAALTLKIWKVGSNPWQYSATMSFTGCTFTKGLYFNDVELVNGNVNNITNSLGGKGWNVSGSTKIYSEIDAIMAFAAVIEIGSDVSGHQYVMSPYASGSFIVKSETGSTYTHNTKCYISAPIIVDKFYKTYIYSVDIAQSFFSEVQI